MSCVSCRLPLIVRGLPFHFSCIPYKCRGPFKSALHRLSPQLETQGTHFSGLWGKCQKMRNKAQHGCWTLSRCLLASIYCMLLSGRGDNGERVQGLAGKGIWEALGRRRRGAEQEKELFPRGVHVAELSVGLTSSLSTFQSSCIRCLPSHLAFQGRGL